MNKLTSSSWFFFMKLKPALIFTGLNIFDARDNIAENICLQNVSFSDYKIPLMLLMNLYCILSFVF